MGSSKRDSFDLAITAWVHIFGIAQTSESFSLRGRLDEATQ